MKIRFVRYGMNRQEEMEETVEVYNDISPMEFLEYLVEDLQELFSDGLSKFSLERVE